jgi:hypothetical protein
VLMTKFGKSGKAGLSNLPLRNIRFWHFQSKTEEGAKIEDLKIQCVLKQENGLKRHQGTKIEENQARSQGHKNQTIRFATPEHPVLAVSEQNRGRS